ncbi:MAG: TldD/PmbA family protein [Oscillospiraceae bacterium]|jgi:PmbA protein|nr:TldD/PmbA family protein [Oscillospiraceae bacterium]
MQELQTIAQQTLDALKAAGASDAQVTVTRHEQDEFTAEAGKLTLLRSTRAGGVSMKALVDGRKGVSTLNSLDAADIEQAAQECVQSAQGATPDKAEQIAPLTENGDFSSGVLSPDRETLFARTAEFLADVAREFPTISLESVTADYGHETAVVMNTHGVCFTDESGAYGFGAMFSAKEGADTSSFNNIGVSLEKLDEPFLRIGNHRLQLAQSAASVHTVPFGEKLVGTVVLTPECFGELLSEAVGTFCGDSAILDGTSPWKDKLGQAVAAPLLTVRCAPHDPRVVCGERICEGYRAQDADVIREGVLAHFLLSQYAANKTGHPRFPNGGENLIVEGGEEPLDKLIAGIERGLLVGRFSGGAPGGNGDFSGVAKNSFLIEHGQLTHAVSETMIAGNLAELLQNIRALSAETLFDGNVVLPYAVADGVTIS